MGVRIGSDLTLKAKKIDFSHKDPLWAIYFKSDDEREAIDPKLNDYLTPDAFTLRRLRLQMQAFLQSSCPD